MIWARIDLDSIPDIFQESVSCVVEFKTAHPSLRFIHHDSHPHLPFLPRHLASILLLLLLVITKGITTNL
jgi:hypothetical protein